MNYRNVSNNVWLGNLGLFVTVVLDYSDDEGLHREEYNLIANGQGFEISRKGGATDETYVNFNSFVQPSDPQEHEKDLIAMLTPSFQDEDREMIDLGSLLSIHWQAGSGEDEIERQVTKFTKRFEV